METTLTPLYSIYNNVLFNGKTNKKTINVNELQFAFKTSGNSPTVGTLFFYKNARLIGSNFSAYNSTYSCALIDTSATSFFSTTPSNEKLIISYAVGDGNNLNQTLNDINILPGEVLTIGGSIGSGTTTIFFLSINVTEND